MRHAGRAALASAIVALSRLQIRMNARREAL